MRRFLRLFLGLVLAIAFGFGAQPAEAQYFGRNKVTYDDFDFRVLETEHFEIYFYDEEEQAARDAARMAERWYTRHTRTFVHTFDEKKPLVFYANDADFQQTNIVRQVSQGTGGLTEPRRERVVMPFTGSYGEFDHVLGHELVHSFQFDLALNSDSAQIRMQQLPLWFVEGMAEYLSVGRKDPHTAMWMRDAALRDDLPSFEQLSNAREYFPYRYGQAFLAYIGGKYGDQAITDLYKTGGRIGLDNAINQLYGISGDSLATEWAEATKETYLPLAGDRTPADSLGQRVLTENDLNIAPSLSPDGRYVAYISSNIFNLTLFVADAETGEVITELGGAGTIPHFDALRFISSAGAWGPNGERLAFISFAEGDNEIAIWNVDENEITERFEVAGVSAMKNVAWSPDGTQLAFSGMDGGISDLYVMDMETREARQLTNDRYADLQPTWSPDGSKIAFTTDRTRTDLQSLDTSTDMSLALIDVESGAVEVRTPFPDALHHNPQFAPDGQSLYFIADQDGFKDIYRMDLTTGRLHRVTHLQTGVSGITALSPAMSVARQNGDLMLSVFSDGGYTGVALPGSEAQGTAMDDAARPLLSGAELASAPEPGDEGVPGALPPEAGVLPLYNALGEGLVASYLDDPLTGLPTVNEYTTYNYDPSLSLESIAPPSVGVSVGGQFGTQAAGGVGFRFTDMLNNQSLTAVVQARGTLKDIGGQVSYLNRGNQFNYGASVGHIPRRFSQALPPTQVNGVPIVNQVIQRIFIDQASLSGAYPLSPNRRFEMSVGGVRYGFDNEIRSFDLRTGRRLDTDRLPDEALPEISEPDPLYLAQSSVAYVVDYSFMGLTSPIRGGRYRLEVSPLIGGESSYVKALADYRRYVHARPFTFAFQGLHIGNYGASQDELFASEYIGLPYYRGFVRGYNLRSFSTSECTTTGCQEVGNLIGTRMAKASAEVRVPLLGPPQISLIPFQYVPTELALFADAGVAWTENEAPDLEFSTNLEGRTPVFSAGVAARFNVLGALVLETYWAYPFQRPNSDGEFGLLFTPGW